MTETVKSRFTRARLVAGPLEAHATQGCPEVLLATLHIGLNGEQVVDLSVIHPDYAPYTWWPLDDYLDDIWPATPLHGVSP